jgi:hypothetical protein
MPSILCHASDTAPWTTIPKMNPLYPGSPDPFLSPIRRLAILVSPVVGCSGEAPVGLHGPLYEDHDLVDADQDLP